MTMEPDICSVIRHAMALSLDCHEMYGWDFAETYRALMRYVADERPRSAAAWVDVLDGLDASDLELPDTDE